MPLGVGGSESAIPPALGTPAVSEGIIPAAPVKRSPGGISALSVPPSTEPTTAPVAPLVAASIENPWSTGEPLATPVLCPGERKEDGTVSEAVKSSTLNGSSRSCSKGSASENPVRPRLRQVETDPPHADHHHRA